MRRGFKTWAEKLALEKRNILNLSSLGTLPAELLGNHLEVTIIGPEDIPGIPSKILHQLLYIDRESWSATTFVRNGCTVIIHNTTHYRRRRESNLMLELAHIKCIHIPSKIIQFDYLPFPLRSYNHEKKKRPSD